MPAGVDQKKIKSWSKEYTRKNALNFDQLKTFLENYKPTGICIGLVYKINENKYLS